jgi:hypothetical protein
MSVAERQFEPLAPAPETSGDAVLLFDSGPALRGARVVGQITSPVNGRRQAWQDLFACQLDGNPAIGATFTNRLGEFQLEFDLPVVFASRSAEASWMKLFSPYTEPSQAKRQKRLGLGGCCRPNGLEVTVKSNPCELRV